MIAIILCLMIIIFCYYQRCSSNSSTDPIGSRFSKFCKSIAGSKKLTEEQHHRLGRCDERSHLVPANNLNASRNFEFIILP